MLKYNLNRRIATAIIITITCHCFFSFIFSQSSATTMHHYRVYAVNRSASVRLTCDRNTDQFGGKKSSTLYSWTVRNQMSAQQQFEESQIRKNWIQVKLDSPLRSGLYSCQVVKTNNNQIEDYHIKILDDQAVQSDCGGRKSGPCFLLPNLPTYNQIEVNQDQTNQIELDCSSTHGLSSSFSSISLSRLQFSYAWYRMPTQFFSRFAPRKIAPILSSNYAISSKAKFTLKNVKWWHTARYKCVAQLRDSGPYSPFFSTQSRIISRVFSLIVKTNKLLVNDTDKLEKVNRGGNFRLECRIPRHPNITIFFQWYKKSPELKKLKVDVISTDQQATLQQQESGSGGGNVRPLYDQISSSYTVHDAQSVHSGEYICFAMYYALAKHKSFPQHKLNTRKFFVQVLSDSSASTALNQQHSRRGKGNASSKNERNSLKRPHLVSPSPTYDDVAAHPRHNPLKSERQQVQWTYYAMIPLAVCLVGLAMFILFLIRRRLQHRQKPQFGASLTSSGAVGGAGGGETGSSLRSTAATALLLARSNATPPTSTSSFIASPQTGPPPHTNTLARPGMAILQHQQQQQQLSMQLANGVPACVSGDSGGSAASTGSHTLAHTHLHAHTHTQMGGATPQPSSCPFLSADNRSPPSAAMECAASPHPAFHTVHALPPQFQAFGPHQNSPLPPPIPFVFSSASSPPPLNVQSQQSHGPPFKRV